MLNKVPEKTMHLVGWLLTIGWFVLIMSFFFDPITPMFTSPEALGSPFRLNSEIYLDPQKCVKIRELCIPEKPFSMSAIMWWAMIVPCGIFILLVLGRGFWRRIYPLSFLSTVYTGSRSLLGSQSYLQPQGAPTQSMCRTVDPKTGQEQSACVACKSVCIDIDAEKTYWTERPEPRRC